MTPYISLKCARRAKSASRLALVAGLLLPCFAWTAGVPNPLQIHGFASQGFVLTSDNNFYGKSSDDGGSWDFRELGLNGSFRASPRLLTSLQLLSRRAGASSDDDIELDYAFLDYLVHSRETNQWGIRLGRVKNPMGFYNDTRDVAFTRPSIILPQSIYFDRARNVALSADGGQIYGEYRTHTGIFDFIFEVAAPRVDDLDTELALLGADRTGSLEDDVSYLARLMYERDGGRFRVAYSDLRVNIDYKPGSIDPSGPGSIQFLPKILSFQYNSEKWTLTSEIARREFRFNDLSAYIPFTEVTGESYYLHGTYRLTPSWETFLRYDVIYQNKDDRNGRKFEKRTGAPAHSQFAKDWTVGIRWDITPAWMFAMEHHWVDGTAWLPQRDNPDPLATVQRWRLFTFLVSFRF